MSELPGVGCEETGSSNAAATVAGVPAHSRNPELGPLPMMPTPHPFEELRGRNPRNPYDPVTQRELWNAWQAASAAGARMMLFALLPYLGGDD